MFRRIFSMFMAVIILVTVTLSAISWIVLRELQINLRLEALKQEARDIAWLAANRTSRHYNDFFNSDSTWTAYLNERVSSIYEEYGAYIAIVDRYGNVMDNMRSTTYHDPDFAATLDGTEISEALSRVVRGEEISVRLDTDDGATFTVGVPYTENEVLRGAVLIQTRAQIVEGGLADLLKQTIAVAVIALIVAAVCVWFYTRGAMKPLKQMQTAANHMADGDFSVRADVSHATRELRELGGAFNSMADQLSVTEQSRRDFVANVSHELRSPITSISGFVDGMLDGTIPGEEHERYLRVVSEESRRLSKLVGDLLSLSRLERVDAELKRTAFDICELLRRAVIRRMNDLDARRISIDCDFEDEHCMVSADSDRIEEVVINLLDNAIKFTPDNGTITLRVRSGKPCRITIADSGIGILPEDRPRVFERFFTENRAHTAGGGTGLGLSICKQIMLMHGQSIMLDEVESGASFTFTLDPA